MVLWQEEFLYQTVCSKYQVDERAFAVAVAACSGHNSSSFVWGHAGAAFRAGTAPEGSTSQCPTCWGPSFGSYLTKTQDARRVTKLLKLVLPVHPR
eukprot:800054-Amphidinium_carterae.1